MVQHLRSNCKIKTNNTTKPPSHAIITGLYAIMRNYTNVLHNCNRDQLKKYLNLQVHNNHAIISWVIYKCTPVTNTQLTAIENSTPLWLKEKTWNWWEEPGAVVMKERIPVEGCRGEIVHIAESCRRLTSTS